MSPLNLRFIVDAADVGPGGHVHAGTLTRWLDQAGYACASAWAGGPCVSMYLSSLRLRRPLRAGDLVEVTARLAFTGQTHMNVTVEMHGGPVGAPREKVTDCLVVYVAVDPAGRPRPVDQWTPQTPGEMAVASAARAQFDSTRPAPLE